MPTFAYKAKSGPEQVVEGLVEAESRGVAIEKLSRMGCFPILVEESASGGHGGRAAGAWSFWERIRAQDLTLFTRQLSDLLESGVPLMRALKVVQRQTGNAPLAALLTETVAAVEGGKSLSGALADRPDVFSSLYVNLVRAGEAAGMLGVTLGRLADFTEQEDELRSRLKAAMVYPALVAVVGAGTVVFLVTFVVPKLAGMFAETGQSLPFMTRALLALSGFMTGRGWIVIAVGLGLCGLAARGRWDAAKSSWSRLSIRVPVWGDLMKKVSIARFARTLATLLAGGVPILESLDVVSGVLGHPALRDQVLDAARSVREGAGLAESLRRSPDFPPFICNMIAVGEEGNILEKSLLKIAVTYERESDRAIKTLSSLLEPVMILGVGSVIGMIVIALLLPIFQISAFVK